MSESILSILAFISESLTYFKFTMRFECDININGYCRHFNLPVIITCLLEFHHQNKLNAKTAKC